MNNDIDCPICFENLLGRFQIITPCNHIFCLQCFLTIKTINCPLCRKNIYLPNNILENIHNKTRFIPNNKDDFPPLE